MKLNDLLGIETALADVEPGGKCRGRDHLLRLGNGLLVEVESERTPVRVGEEFGARPVGLKSKDAPALDARVDASVRRDGDAFGRVPADRQSLCWREARVRLVDARERRGGRRLPRRRLNRHGPEQKVERDERREQKDGEQEFTFHGEPEVSGGFEISNLRFEILCASVSAVAICFSIA